MKNRVLTVTLNPAVDYSIQVPAFSPGRVNRALSGRRYAGGKGLNVAAALAMYGVETAAAGFLGESGAELFRVHMERYGIEDRFTMVSGRCREGIKITDPEAGTTTDINFPGISIRKEDLERFIRGFGSIAEGFDYLVLSGSIPPGVPADIYARLAEAFPEGRDGFIALDTTGEAFNEGIGSGRIGLVKPNIHELHDLYPGTAVDEAAQMLQKMVPLTALSIGGDGSRLYTENGCWEANAPKVQLTSTVGAGDSFLAGFIHAHIRGDDPAGQLRTAAATAASKLTKSGSGWSEESPPESFLDSIKVRSRVPDQNPSSQL